MSNKIKILIADDELLFRKGISFLLDLETNIEIIFEASNGEEVISYLKENKTIHPDIILMDLKMPLLNGVEATKMIRNEFPDIKIIALTSFNTKSFIANIIQVGAVAYLVKTSSPDDVVSTINEVFEKGFFYDEPVLQVINEGLLDSKVKTNLDEDYLTEREKEILILIAHQYSTAQIAEKLGLSQRTVEGHRSTLIFKTEAKNVASLLIYALQYKIVILEDLLQT